MKLSELIKHRFIESDFTNMETFAESLGLSVSPVKAAINGTGSMKRIDDIFEALTSDISTEEFISVFETIELLRRKQIEREQFL